MSRIDRENRDAAHVYVTEQYRVGRRKGGLHAKIAGSVKGCWRLPECVEVPFLRTAIVKPFVAPVNLVSCDSLTWFLMP